MNNSNYQKQVDELADIMRILADVWPGDREDIMVAGARLEDAMEGLQQESGRLSSLISLAWKGLIHLYEKDDYFQSVKSATMQAINTIREYAVTNGDIEIDLFEKACDELEKSMKGDSETVDSMTLTEEARTSGNADKEEKDSTKPQKSKKADSEASNNEEVSEEPMASRASSTVTLDDVASFIMGFDSKESAEKQYDDLIDLIDNCHDGVIELIKKPLKEALNILKTNHPSKGDEVVDIGTVIGTVSKKVEKAIQLEEEGEQAEKAEVETEPVSEPDTEQVVVDVDFYMPEDTDLDLMSEFITETMEQIEMAESALLDLETTPEDDELINKVFRSFHTMKGTAAFMGLTPMSEFAHSVETLLDMVRDDVLPYDSACADITLEAIDIIKNLIESVEKAENGQKLDIPPAYPKLMSVLVHISDFGKSPAEAMEAYFSKEDRPVNKEASSISDEQNVSKEPSSSEKATNGTPESIAGDVTTSRNEGKAQKVSASKPPKAEAESTVRVNVDRLDRLIDMVGELVIAHSVVAQDRAIEADPELSRKMTHSTKILRELQDTSLTLRMVPLKATFNKMNRLVRDLGKKAGKTVRLSMSGEDTEIDRNMVDIINEPLVHLLRNAIDHGIEDSDQRAKSGKSGIATIGLHAFQAGGKVVIKIEDDGRGMNKEKILEKAISKGLIEPGKKLTDNEIFKLIFLPGFSTAEKVTDLSGRGVGMDVVRRSIEKLHGKVEVSSTPGQGTKIFLELPFTLAITDGMLIRIGEQRFIVPTINIDMTFRAEEQDLFTVMESGEHVMFRGESIPIIRLHRLFQIENCVESILEGTMLVINNNKKKYALLVDEVIGQQQLVGKSINMPVKMRNISGGAILGDGKVGLILDTVSLLN